MANEQNLLKGDERHKFTPEEHSRGGIASGKARRERATMLSTLKKLLDEEYKNTGMTYRDMATLGLIKGAVKGNAVNYKTMVELLGETKGGESQTGVLTDLVEALNNARKKD